MTDWFGICMVAPLVQHAPPQRHPNVDENPYFFECTNPENGRENSQSGGCCTCTENQQIGPSHCLSQIEILIKTDSLAAFLTSII